MLLRGAYHAGGYARELRYLYSVALRSRTFLQRVQENDLVLVLDRVEVNVGDLAVFLGDLRQIEAFR